MVGWALRQGRTLPRHRHRLPHHGDTMGTVGPRVPRASRAAAPRQPRGVPPQPSPCPHLGSVALPESPPEHGHHPVAAGNQQGLVRRHGPVIHAENHVWGGTGTGSARGRHPSAVPVPHQGLVQGWCRDASPTHRSQPSTGTAAQPHGCQGWRGEGTRALGAQPSVALVEGQRSGQPRAQVRAWPIRS